MHTSKRVTVQEVTNVGFLADNLTNSKIYAGKKYLYIQYIVECLENPFSFIHLFIAFVAKDFSVFISSVFQTDKQNRATCDLTVRWLSNAKFHILADLPECSWSSCWKCGPWLRCRRRPGWGWTPPPLRLVTEQPRCGCGSQGFSATGLHGWRHTAHLDCCIPLLGSTAPVAPHDSTSRTVEWELVRREIFKIAPSLNYTCTIFYTGQTFPVFG